MVIDGVAVFTVVVVKISDEKRIKSGLTKIDFLGLPTLLASIIIFQYDLDYGSTTFD